MMIRRQKVTMRTAPTADSVSTSDASSSLPTRQDMPDTDGLQGTIAARAYALYEERGYRQGCDLQDWLDAEREIRSRQPPT